MQRDIRVVLCKRGVLYAAGNEVVVSVPMWQVSTYRRTAPSHDFPPALRVRHCTGIRCSCRHVNSKLLLFTLFVIASFGPAQRTRDASVVVTTPSPNLARPPGPQGLPPSPPSQYFVYTHRAAN